MANYNPSATELLGIELNPNGASVLTIPSIGVGSAIRVRSLAAETINQVRLWLDAVTIEGTFVLDIYVDGTELFTGDWTDYISTIYSANEDVSVSNLHGNIVDTAGLRYQNIDEDQSASGPDSGDYIYFNAGTYDAYYSFRFGSAGFTGRPIDVGWAWQVENSVLSPFTMTTALGPDLSGVFYPLRSFDMPPGVSVGEYSPQLLNPSTGLPWTAANVTAFDSTNEFACQIRNPDGSNHRLVCCDMRVRSVAENRVATGSITLGVGGAAYRDITVQAPGGGNWSKSNGVDYLYVFRRVSAAGAAKVGSLGISSPSVLVTNFYGYNVTLVDGLVTSKTGVNRLPGIIVRTTAPANSADSQSYPRHYEPTVTSSLTQTTEFSNAAVKLYGRLKFICKANGTPSQPLTVKVKRRSDNVQMGSTVTVTADALANNTTDAVISDITDIGNGWKLVDAALGTPVTLAASTQYYVEWTTTGDDSYSLLGLDQTSGLGALGFGGTTDRGTDTAGTEQNHMDIWFQFSTVPTAPTNLAAALGTQTITTDGSPEVPTTLQRVQLTWSATALGGSFSRYDIARSEDGGATWHIFASPSAEATVSRHDYEMIRAGTVVRYKMRVVRVDGAASGWTSEVTVTPAKLPIDTWAFVSNEDPTLNLVYKKVQGIDYTFPDANEVELHPVSGANYFMALQPEEDRGVQGQLMLVVSSLSSYNQSTNPLGWAAFTRLRTLARGLGLSYTCILDPYGNRVLAKLTVPNAPYQSPTVFWYAMVNFWQVTDVFSKPTAGS